MAMRQHRFTALGLALALVLGACGSEPDEFSVPDSEDDPVAEQAPADAPTDEDEDADEENDVPEAEPFESPLIEEDEATAAPSGLISSTNPQERSRQAQRNLDAAREDGADPFGVLPVEVSRSQRQAETIAREVTEEPEPGTPEASENGRTATRTGNGTATQTGDGTETDGIVAGPPLPPLTGQTMEPLPDINPRDFAISPLRPSGTVSADDVEEDDEMPVADSPSSIPEAEELPPPPATDLAEGTEVTGVMQVGGDIQIILQTPGSAFSRYVRVGDTIANGEVRVVRVESLNSEPLVILEQNGVEIARGIGEPGMGSEDEDMANWVSSH
ncbi:MAG: Type IV pilus biogenesis [Phormidium sp. OSCR]|nr:MAG: Type IV pilus biogenesis [Phormidium sp. OSCR]